MNQPNYEQSLQLERAARQQAELDKVNLEREAASRDYVAARAMNDYAAESEALGRIHRSEALFDRLNDERANDSKMRKSLR
jgi:hypothetical protein